MSGVGPPAARAALFDLDGTLLDTAHDLAAAMGDLLAEHGRPPLPFEPLRAQVSNGSYALTRMAFPELAEGSEPWEARRLRLLDLYRPRVADRTRPFAGMDDALRALEAAGVPWGVVTNKPRWLTEPLLAALGLGVRATVVVAGDDFPERKPHPRQLLHAAQVLGLAPADCLYVGDALRDVQAAVAAGMRPVGVRFGYVDPQADPGSWPVERWIDHPADLLPLVGLAGVAA